MASTPSESAKPKEKLGFGRFVLDPETGRLLGGRNVIPLAPKPFETLLYLARRAGRVVTKAELMEQLWPGTFVTDDVLVQCIVDVRRALGDSARAPEFVETIPRRGYQFRARVEVVVEEGTLPPTPGLEAAEPEPGPGETAPAETPGRRLQRLLPWLGLAALLAAASGVWLARRDRPGIDLSRLGPPSPMEPGALLVLPIEVRGATPETEWLRLGLAEVIRSELLDRPGARQLPRHRLAEALNQAWGQPARPPTREASLALARHLGAERLVAGTFMLVGDAFVMNAQLVLAAAGAVESEATVRGEYPRELLAAVDELCARLAEGWGGSARGQPVLAEWRPVQLATRSVEAYRHYAEALVWFARGGNRGAEEAETRLDQAVRLDPSFAHAHLKKAEIQSWRRRMGYGEPDPEPAVRAAASLAKQLGERERLLIRAMEAEIVSSQPEAALALYAELLRLQPGFAAEVGVPRRMADILYLEGRWNDLITVGEAHVGSAAQPASERALLSALLAKAFRQKGEFGRALTDAGRAVRLWPTQEGPSFLRQRTDLGRISLDAGRREAALAEFRAVAAAPEADVTNLTDAAWGLYMAGSRAEAESLCRKALALDEGYGNAHHLLGWLRLAAGDAKQAASSFEQAFERTPRGFGAAHLGFVGGDLAALYYAGVAHQKQGAGEQARRAFQRVIEGARRFLAARPASAPAAFEAESFLAIASARLGRPAPEPRRLSGDDATYFLESARLHAVKGRREQALGELAQALALGPGERQHVADDPNFESLRSDPEFVRLTAAAGR